MEIAALLAVLLSGFVVGLLARFAVPGPDPMPIWKTLLFGVAGSFLGGGVGYGIAAEWGAFMGSVIAATILVLLYRRFVQKRPITGPGAKLRPGR
jgi:uncharacterized membrane protein YeaQ/YmgE (transglycosylase-associated protein family)